MVVRLCRNRVAEFEKWKSVFDSNAPAARDAGLRLMNLWRDVEEPNAARATERPDTSLTQ